MLGVKIHRVLAGTDGPGQKALPLGEFLHPLPLLALIALVVNDHLLKGSGVLSGAVTGKISDFAGLVFFPLLCTAAVDLLLLGAARLGAPVDFSLRPYKLAVATLGTAVLFTLIKLSNDAALTVADILSTIGFPSAIVADPTDLAALPALALACWVGSSEIARVPLGRLEVLERAWQRARTPLEPELRDVARFRGLLCRRLGGDSRTRSEASEQARALASAMERYAETRSTEAAAAAKVALTYFREPRAAPGRRP